MSGTRLFHITEEHLKLLRRMNVGWNGNEAGAPTINAKRPYGNGDEIEDIHKILTGGKLSDVDSKSEELRLRKYYRELHEQTEEVLQICLMFGTFEAGCYQTDGGYRDWKKVE